MLMYKMSILCRLHCDMDLVSRMNCNILTCKPLPLKYLFEVISMEVSRLSAICFVNVFLLGIFFLG